MGDFSYQVVHINVPSIVMIIITTYCAKLCVDCLFSQINNIYIYIGVCVCVCPSISFSATHSIVRFLIGFSFYLFIIVSAIPRPPKTSIYHYICVTY